MAALLARLRIDQKDYQAAEEVLSNAERAAPESAAAELAMAETHLVVRRYGKAEEDARKALTLDPNSAEALWTLAPGQLALGLQDEAERTCRRLAALNDPKFKTAHALFLYVSGKRAAAIAELNTLVKADPQDRKARSQLVAAYEDMDKMDDAQQVLKAALKRNPRDTDALMQRSELALRAGNTRQAEEDLRAALRFLPDSTTAHYLMAMVYDALQKQSEGRQELERALQLNPRFLQARIALARGLTRANQAKSALQVLDATPESQKNLQTVVTERNWALIKDGDLQRARAVLDRVLPRHKLPELLLPDAAIKLSAHDYSGARSSAEAALAQNREDVRAARAIAQSYAEENQLPRALRRLEEIAAEHPKSAPLQELLGSWYATAGRTNEARASFKTARSLRNPFRPKLLWRNWTIASAIWIRRCSVCVQSWPVNPATLSRRSCSPTIHERPATGNQADGAPLLADALRQDPNLPKTENGW